MEAAPANSPDEWVDLASRCHAAAVLLAKDPKTAPRAWNEAGFAVECMIKAVIMKQQRLNRWPDRQERPDLWVHNLRALFKIAGAEVGPADEYAAAVVTMFDWNRSHSYNSRNVPPKVISGYMEAAFGDKGVVSWLSRTFLNAA